MSLFKSVNYDNKVYSEMNESLIPPHYEITDFSELKLIAREILKIAHHVESKLLSANLTCLTRDFLLKTQGHKPSEYVNITQHDRDIFRNRLSKMDNLSDKQKEEYIGIFTSMVYKCIGYDVGLMIRDINGTLRYSLTFDNLYDLNPYDSSIPKPYVRDRPFEIVIPTIEELNMMNAEAIKLVDENLLDIQKIRSKYIEMSEVFKDTEPVTVEYESMPIEKSELDNVD